MEGIGRAAFGAGRMVLVAVRESLYPRRCAGCGRRGVWVCAACDAAVPRFAPPWCGRCGAPTGTVACRCPELPSSLDAVRSAGPYAGWLRSAILAFKYEGETDRAAHLGGLLLPAVADLWPADALVPVPLHPRRLRERGYNQATLLARTVGADHVPSIREALVRTRATDQQARLGAEERWENVRDAFAIGEGVDVRGLRILLVDDVLTTGATLGACAEALATAGAAKVVAVTLARES